jgi:hypothetical protein
MFRNILFECLNFIFKDLFASSQSYISKINKTEKLNCFHPMCEQGTATLGITKVSIMILSITIIKCITL